MVGDDQSTDEQIIDGGAGLFNPANIFNYLEKKNRSNKIQIKAMGSDSVGGYLYLIKIKNPDNHFLKICPGGNDLLTPITNILIKFIQIRAASESISHFNDKEVVEPDVFEREVRTQNAIFERSFDMYCEPICPQIFHYGYIHRGSSDINKLSSISFDIGNIFRMNLGGGGGSRNGDKMGFICMELMGDAKEVKNAFPEWEIPPHITYSMSEMQTKIMKNYFYQLVRMNHIGYSHGDIHLKNAMYLENYDYIDGYRVYIIDFGRTMPVVQTDSIYDQLTALPRDVPSDFWSYQQIKYYISEIDRNVGIIKYKDHLRKKRSVSKGRFLEKLYTKLSKLRVLKQIIPRIQNVYIPNEFRYQKLFEYHKIPLRNVDSMVLSNGSININPQCNCCPFVDPDTNQTLYVKPSIQSYSQELITILNKSGLLTTYVNESIHNYTGTYGVFNWIIGTDPVTQQLCFYCILVNNCAEIGTKHISLVQYHGITQIYAAGSMFKENNQIVLNMLSGTYMLTALQNNVLTSSHMEKMNDIVPAFVYETINRGIAETQTLNVHMSPYKDFITRENFCENDYLKRLQIHAFVKYNNYLLPIYGSKLFFGYPDEDTCNPSESASTPMSISSIGGRRDPILALERAVQIESSYQKPRFMNLNKDNGMVKESSNRFDIKKYKSLVDKNDTYLGSQELNTISIPFREEGRKHIQQLNDGLKDRIFKENLSIIIEYVRGIQINARKSGINTILLEDADIKETLLSKKIIRRSTRRSTHSTRSTRSRRSSTRRSSTRKIKTSTKKSTKTKRRRNSAP